MNSNKSQVTQGPKKIQFGESKLNYGNNMIERLLNTIKSEKLKKIVNSDYLPSSTKGDGGTASMLRHEINNGLRTNHLQKSQELVVRYENYILENAGKMDFNDLFIAEKLIQNLKSSINLSNQVN